MAYLVSQKRKESETDYSRSVESISTSTFLSPNTFGSTYTFTDLCLRDVTTSGSSYSKFEQGKVYYLRFKIHQIPQYFYSGRKSRDLVTMYQGDADLLNIQILLKNLPRSQLGAALSEDKTNDQLKLELNNNPPEIIGNIEVPVDVNPISSASTTVDEREITQEIYNRYSSYSLVFSPSKTVDTIGFRVNRVSYDAIYHEEGPRDWLTSNSTEAIPVYTGRTTYKDKIIQVQGLGNFICLGSTNGEISELQNIVGNNQNWLKFGYQSRPGSLIVVNGQPIRVGRSGIYEINNGTVIKEFMIAAPNGDVDAFLLDYAYKG